MTYVYNVVSTSGGDCYVSSGVKTEDVFATTDWSSIQALYQEYRVVAMEWRFLERFSPGNAGVTCGSGAIAPFHVPSVTFTSLDQVVQNAAHKPLNTGKSCVCHWRARGVEEMAWIPTSSTNNHGCIGYWADGASPNTDFGKATVTFLVELRGRK